MTYYKPDVPVVPAEWKKARTAPRKVVQPVAKAGDTILVHVPDIGVWTVDAFVTDYRGRSYYKVSRRTGGAVEFRMIAPQGFEVLRSQIEAE